MLYFPEYQPACSHNETDKTMAEADTDAPASMVANTHKYTWSMYKYSVIQQFNQICLKTKNLPFLNINNVGMAI